MVNISVRNYYNPVINMQRTKKILMKDFDGEEDIGRAIDAVYAAGKVATVFQVLDRFSMSEEDIVDSIDWAVSPLAEIQTRQELEEAVMLAVKYDFLTEKNGGVLLTAKGWKVYDTLIQEEASYRWN